MVLLGIESSCDECAVAVVSDGKDILSNIVVSQIKHHCNYAGVVPELASRLHSEWIGEVCKEAIEVSGCSLAAIDGVAVSNRPGLVGSLLVGVAFAKAFAWSRNRPLIAVDHILGHIYAVQMECQVAYPHLTLLASGGHTLIAQVNRYDDVDILGSTIDDACGEAFDKVAKHYQLGYPGGPAIDRLAGCGNENAYHFPQPRLKERPGRRPLDVSYSGLKTAAISQADKFGNPAFASPTVADLAASFQKAAVEMLLDRVQRAVASTGLTRLVIGGGVAANSYLRKRLQQLSGLDVYLPSLNLCVDNAAMIAGVGYHYYNDEIFSDLDISARPVSSLFGS